MTAFPSLTIPFGLRRILRVNVIQKMRRNLELERIWVNRHIQHAWEYPWPVLTDANRVTLETFMATCRGKYLGNITHVDPWDAVSYTTSCRLDIDELLLTEILQSRWTGSIRILEVSGFKANKAAVATFPSTVPLQAYARGLRYKTVVQAVPGDTETRYEEFGYSPGIRRWAVGGDVLTDAQATDLLACWEGNGGPWAAFDFTDPETSVTCIAHFVETELSHTLVCLRANGQKVHSIHATVEWLDSYA
jgi:hypothetical protein